MGALNGKPLHCSSLMSPTSYHTGVRKNRSENHLCQSHTNLRVENAIQVNCNIHSTIWYHLTSFLCYDPMLSKWQNTFANKRGADTSEAQPIGIGLVKVCATPEPYNPLFFTS